MASTEGEREKERGTGKLGWSLRSPPAIQQSATLVAWP